MADQRKTYIINHSCAHDYQDKVYGKHKRVATVRGGGKDKTDNDRGRCTVCGGDVDLRDAEVHD